MRYDPELAKFHAAVQEDRHGKSCSKCRQARGSITVSFAVDGVAVADRQVCTFCFIAMYDSFTEIQNAIDNIVRGGRDENASRD